MYNVLALCIALFVVGKASGGTICLKTCAVAGDFTCKQSDNPTAGVVAGDCDIAVAYANDLVDNVDKDLQLLVAATYPNTGMVRYYGVAVVKKDSGIKSLKDLKGKKSCHTGVGKTSGWVIPVGTLLRKNLMDFTENQYVSAAGFFNGSCAPGIKGQSANVQGKLCEICKSNCSSSDSYAGYDGAFRCLSEGTGDVAFTKYAALPKTGIDSYELLCSNVDGTKAISEYASCYVGKRPAAVIVTIKGKDAATLKSYRDKIQAAASNFTALIHENATSLTEVDKTAKEYLGDYLLNKQALDGPKKTNGATNLVVWHVLYAIAVFLAFWKY